MTSPLLKAVEETRGAAAPATNADKARALIAMLEQGRDAPTDVPPDRLRDWARDLIRTVEGAAPAAAPSQPEAPRRRRLFSADAPKLAPTSPAAPPRAAPPAPQAAPTGRLTLTAPMPHSPEGSVKAPGPALHSTFSTAEVRKVVDATVDPASLGREHPAIIAMTLLGKPTLEQASALRSLASGQVRAVHKALRQLEQAAPSGEEMRPRTA